jgi:hypothetical protein
VIAAISATTNALTVKPEEIAIIRGELLVAARRFSQRLLSVD